MKDNIPTRRPAIMTIAIIVTCSARVLRAGEGGIKGPDDQKIVKYAPIPYELTHPGEESRRGPTGAVVCEGQ